MPRSTAEIAYEYVKCAVIKGDFVPGSLLSESGVGERLGISRTPVHEAFLRLATEGLLDLFPRRGAVVCPMAPTELADVFEMHEALENSAATRLIKERRVDALLPKLGQLATAQTRALDAKDVKGYLRLDDRFHFAIVEASGNRLASDLFLQLRDREHRLRAQAGGPAVQELGGAIIEHRRLVEALDAARTTQYAEVLHVHLAVHLGGVT